MDISHYSRLISKSHLFQYIQGVISLKVPFCRERVLGSEDGVAETSQSSTSVSPDFASMKMPAFSMSSRCLGVQAAGELPLSVDYL